MISGSCLCEAVRYEVEGPVEQLWHCHCSMCRKHHGAPFATLVDVPAERFRWITGDDSVHDFSSSPGQVRRSCKVCGSVAPTPVQGRVAVPAGNLVGELGAVRNVHAFVGSKAPWHVIAEGPRHEGALRYEGAPPGWPDEVVGPTPPAIDGATRGSCLCGRVSFSVSGPPLRWMQCHCSRCRRGRSAAHGSNGFYPLAQFSWLSGRELVRSYRPPEAERFMVCFCAECGGGAPTERENVPFVLVPMGLLDTDPGVRPQAHIHVASKAPWYAIEDELPQYAELPPS